MAQENWSYLPISDVAVGDVVEEPGTEASWTVNSVVVGPRRVAISAGDGYFKLQAMASQKLWVLKK